MGNWHKIFLPNSGGGWGSIWGHRAGSVVRIKCSYRGPGSGSQHQVSSLTTSHRRSDSSGLGAYLTDLCIHPQTHRHSTNKIHLRRTPFCQTTKSAKSTSYMHCVFIGPVDLVLMTVKTHCGLTVSEKQTTKPKWSNKSLSDTMFHILTKQALKTSYSPVSSAGLTQGLKAWTRHGTYTF